MAVTVRTVDSLIAPSIAAIVVWPVTFELIESRREALRRASAGLEIVATVTAPRSSTSPGCQRSCVVPSLYVPIAVNCSAVPFAIDGLGGVTAIETSTASVTVSVVSAKMLLLGSVARTCVAPSAAAVAMPFDPAAFEIVAMPVAEEVHSTWLVMSRVVASV